jgi:aspartate/tyrosine/aromatic aminotransferase
VDFNGMLEDLSKAPENSVIVLHMAAHNPTGCDLTQEQLTLVADVMEVCLSYITNILENSVITPVVLSLFLFTDK